MALTSKSNITDNISVMKFKLGMAIYRLMHIYNALAARFNTLTLMQGPSGSAEAEIYIYMACPSKSFFYLFPSLFLFCKLCRIMPVCVCVSHIT